MPGRPSPLLCAALTALGLMLPAGRAAAQVSGGAVWIGVLTEMSDPFSDIGGRGSVLAAEMAAQDAGGSVTGTPVQILSADHQNKPDLGSSIARAWFERDGVDAISWFVLTADDAFGQAMERDAVAVKASGGTLKGTLRHPLATSDFSSSRLQAQASGAQIIWLASAGGDTINAITQATEFGITDGGQRVAGFLVFISDVHSVGLPVAKGWLVSTGFYWDQNEAARTIGKRFFAKTGRMPTKQQATVYASVTQYLKAVEITGTEVNHSMRKLPVDDCGRAASIRADGRVLDDLTLYEVKAPGESKAPYDDDTPRVTSQAAGAFRPEGDGGCATAP